MRKLLKKILYSNPVTRGLVINGRQMFRWIVFARPYFLTRVFHPETVFFVMIPEHGNLGDHAIAHSIRALLRENRISWQEVTQRELYRLWCKCALDVFNGRTIFVNGGGNLGTLWFEGEQMARWVISANPKSPILIFPHSFYYEDTPWGREELCRAAALYNAHPRLTVFARERVSYDRMKAVCRDVRLAPDMAMAMGSPCGSVSRSGGLLCLREDRERTRSDEETQILLEQMQAHFGQDVDRLDTVLPYEVKPSEAAAELETLFAKLSAARLVVTDRLHGMIFCAVTGTPCILINSKSPKIRGCYEWVRELPYIRYADTAAEAVRNIPDLLALDEQTYDPSFLLPCYAPLREAVMAAIQK